jgi:N-methylhydantoinase A
VGDNLGMASVAVHSIGAGGGSIAWVDPGGLLRVGPHSAGSEPGPACYGRGGTEPTVTDAAVVLGYIDPAHFLGGRMPLDEAAAARVVGEFGKRVGESTERAAFAIMTVANENMIQAIKELTINEGLNPSDSVLIAGGGAGGLGAMPIAAELGCKTVLVPRTAGALSASGMQFSDIITETGASKLTTSDNFDFEGVNAALGAIDARLNEFAARLRERGFTDITKRFFVEARYRFQVWELEIEVGRHHFADARDVEALVEEFHRMHDRVFAVKDVGQAVECLNWRGRLIAGVNAPSLEPARAVVTGKARADRTRQAYFGAGPVATPVYLGEQLETGAVIEGPAIIEEPTSTLVVYPGARARVSAGGRYILTPPPSSH